MDSVDTLSGKILVMIVGPTAVGKSAVMHEVARQDSEFSYCRTFTTRLKRTNETETYRHVTTKEAELIQTSGKAITYFRHPTTGIIYGTDKASYPNRYNLLDTLSNTVETYRGLSFERTVTVSLTAEPDTWELWLARRFPEPNEEWTKRLEEAKRSIEWSLRQTKHHHWLVNRPNELGVTAQQLIDIVEHDKQADSSPLYAEKMHQTVIRLLSYQ